MGDWKKHRLSEVIEKFIDYRGKTPTKTTSGIPLITAKIVKNGRLLEPREFISRAEYKRWMNRGYPEVNDVILTTEAPLGEVALLKDKNVALAQRIITLRGKKGVCDNAFLKYYFQSNIGQSLLLSRAQGSTVEGIKAAELKQLELTLPAFPEQQATGAALSSLDDKIDLLHRQNKTLEALARTLFRQWFIEDADESREVVAITDLIDLNPKRSLTKGTTATYLEMSNLSNEIYHPLGWYDREFTSGTKFVNGDTLLARITPCLENGKTAYVDFLDGDEVGWGSTEFIVMRAKPPLHPFFSYILARQHDFRDFAIGCMVGSSGRQRADVDNLATYEIKLPPREVITRFNEHIEPSLRKMKINNDQIRTLMQLRDTLLPKLMSGEVRVEG